MQLLHAGASFTAVSRMPEGTTALHLAAEDHLESVDALLRHGANPFVQDGRRAPFLCLTLPQHAPDMSSRDINSLSYLQ